MIGFIKGLYYDLIFKINKMFSELEQKSIDSEAGRKFMRDTLNEFKVLKADISRVINSGDLDIELLLTNNIVEFNTLYERFLSIEIFRFLIIIDYGIPEHYFNKKISRIYYEIKCLQSPPLVASVSNSEMYYWAYPKFKVIAVPKGEEKSLLNLPDLYHEIAHLIYKQYFTFLIGNFMDVLKKYYQDEIFRVKNEQRALSLIPFFIDKQNNWINGWVEEFTCDLIATFLVGSAYGWTNIKISTLSSGQKRIYNDSPTHPSDESRMRAIFKMLKLCGLNNTIINLSSSWDMLLNTTSNPIPQHYNYIFPDVLINTLSENVFEGCKNIGLNSYSEQLAEFENPVSKIVNDSWSKVLANPIEFENWEQQTIQNLQISLEQ